MEWIHPNKAVMEVHVKQTATRAVMYRTRFLLPALELPPERSWEWTKIQEKLYESL
jgi:hypothetical protein